MDTRPRLLLVADFFLQRALDDGEMLLHKKLQKLVYYAQARSLVFFDAPLFDEPIEAWINGPVVPVLYHTFKSYGYGALDPIGVFSKGDLGEDIEDLLENIYRVYSPLSADELSRLTHKEDPRKNARKGLEDFQRSENEISRSDMKSFYLKKINNEALQETSK